MSLEVIQPAPVLDPNQFLSLNCFVLDDDQEKMFTVKVLKTDNVSILKKLIKEEKAPHLDYLAASDLRLWKVSIPVDDFNTERLKENTSLEPLKAFLPLLRAFPHVEENHLHVLVKAPSKGKLI